MSREQPSFGGMTVNERLVVAGLVRQFDAAIATDDREQAIQLLERVALSPDNAAATVDAVTAHRSKYGY